MVKSEKWGFGTVLSSIGKNNSSFWRIKVYLPPIEENQFIDSLAKLVTMVVITDEALKMTGIIHRRGELVYFIETGENKETSPWYTNILNYQ